MLDSETKSRIDSARDILVGKVPDTRKAQRHFKRFVGLGLLRKVGASTSTSYEVQRL